MKAVLLIPIVACFVVKVRSKIFSRCELALIMQRWGLDGYEGYNLADWVCLAYFTSGFNTAAVTHNSDGSSEYGIFQINSRLWCSDHHSQTKDLCDLSCRGMGPCQKTDLLTDEIIDDILCLKRAVVGLEGLESWMAWRDHCHDRDLSHWVVACNL